jgi:phosphoenolpyruvate carboxykinase (ATP)
MVAAALSGELDGVETFQDPVFGLEIPMHIEDIPDEVLRPRTTWADPAAYDAMAARLLQMFSDNFRQFAPYVAEEIRAAGPPR